jgi:8-oxo-dGTP pyrophosphatase MutT (NUDIX family)
VTAPALREAARAIFLDPDDCVMLLRYDEKGGFWATPGGSLQPGETSRQAVIRELREELGVGHVDLGPHLATRTKDHQVAGRDVRQAERYYSVGRQPGQQPGVTLVVPGGTHRRQPDCLPGRTHRAAPGHPRLRASRRRRL